MGGAIVSKFSGCPRDGFACKNFGRGSLVDPRKLALFVSHGTSQPCAAAMGSRPAIGTHKGAGRQCADAICNMFVLIGQHTYYTLVTGSGGLGRVKSRTGLPM